MFAFVYIHDLKDMKDKSQANNQSINIYIYIYIYIYICIYMNKIEENYISMKIALTALTANAY